MGTSTLLHAYFQIPKHKIEEARTELKKFLRGELCRLEAVYSDNEFWISDQGYLECDDWYGRWPDDEELAWFFSQYSEGDLIFEDGWDETWGWHFDGKGNAQKLHWECKHGPKDNFVHVTPRSKNTTQEVAQ